LGYTLVLDLDDDAPNHSTNLNESYIQIPKDTQYSPDILANGPHENLYGCEGTEPYYEELLFLHEKPKFVECVRKHVEHWPEGAYLFFVNN
jgi:hypothetical protein